MDCGCDYGLIHEPTPGYRKCNFTDMVTCANGYVKNYIFGILDDKGRASRNMTVNSRTVGYPFES